MRLLFLILSLFMLAEAGFCQHVMQVTADSTGNISATYLPDFDAEKNLYQSGYGNFVFAYSQQDSSKGLFRFSQSGMDNLIFSISGSQSKPVNRVLRQNGTSNRIEIYQSVETDSLSQNKQEVKVEQEGSGNSVTIIQRDK